MTFPGLAILAFLGRHATRLLVGAIFIGIALPPLAALLRPYLSLWIFLLTVSTLLRVDPAAVIAHAKRPGRIILILAWILLATPLLMVAVLSFIPLPRGLVEPLVLWSASPPLASSPAFAFLVGLDGPLALLLMVTATFLMPFTVPPLVLALIGLKLDIGVFELMGRLVLFVGGAAAIAFAVRRLIGPLRMARRATELNGLTVIALVLFGIAVMDGMQAHLRERPGEVLLYAAVTFGATVAQQAVATVAFLWLGRVDALTTGLVTGNKNMAIIWANLGVAAPPEVMLYFAVIQLPIFILPAALRPVYRWALRRREPALTRVGAEQ